jgi:hypothetical protein
VTAPIVFALVVHSLPGDQLQWVRRTRQLWLRQLLIACCFGGRFEGLMLKVLCGSDHTQLVVVITQAVKIHPDNYSVGTKSLRVQRHLHRLTPLNFTAAKLQQICTSSFCCYCCLRMNLCCGMFVQTSMTCQGSLEPHRLEPMMME